MIEKRSEDKSQADQVDLEDKNGTTDMFFQNYINPKPKPSNNGYIRQIKRILQSIGFQVFITTVALFSLFSDDIRMAAFDASADLAFDIIHILLIAIFTVEIILNWIAIEDYKWSFYFFLDLISSFSIILDISMITQLMYSRNNSTYNLSQLAVQSRASRVATRAVRIVKLVRIIRIVKLYKAATHAAEIKQELKKKKMDENKRKQGLKSEYNIKKRENKEESKVAVQEVAENHAQTKKEEDDFLFDSELLEEISEKQSKISKVLSDLTIKKVIIVVLLIMFLVPLFDSDNYIEKAESWDFTVSNIHKILYKVDSIPLASLNKMIEKQIAGHQDSNFLILFSTPFNELPYYSHDRLGKERIQDITSSIESINVKEILEMRRDLTLRKGLTELEDNEIYAIMDYRYNNQRDALFSIGKTCFVCIVLIGMLHFFTEDINELIVVPIEKMMKQVMDMAKNPESVSTSLVDNNQYETAIVHNAIVKIGALLSLVFGSAGAEIIGSNIMKQGDMNPMIGGKKKCAIFGFCDIRNFTEVTELLQEDIMMFVNKIGELVHSSVYRYGGSANKNIGEAFLMVWPLPDDSYKLNNKTNEITWKKEDYVSLMSDYSVYSFIKAIVKIHKDPAVLEYKNDPRLINGLGNDFQVKMGFGLHIGWAIEGAIGSEYKIDASYLSPNVNMASRLEAATKQYGVNLLISEDLHEMLTPGLKNFCRNIDRVTVKGSAKPIRLYTIDLKLQNISPPMDKAIKYKNPDDMLDVQIKKDINMEAFDSEKRDSYDAEQFIKKKKELREVMVNATSEEFRKSFEMGLECYLEGKWADARLHLNVSLKIGKNDGPTKNILNYMKKFDYTAPETWNNYRPLTEK